MKIRNHRLHRDDGTAYPFKRSPNQSSGTITPEVLVMHFTGGASAGSSVNWLTNPDAKASAHLVIGRDGEITQLVAFNRKAWHAGRSRLGSRKNVNNFSIGIELANAGGLKRSGGGWMTDWSKPIESEKVFEAAHKNGGPVRGWEAYPEAQLTTALEVGALLARHYGLKDVVGHEDIAPGRKSDPGPAFPMASYRGSVIGRETAEAEADGDDAFVTTTALNIRTGPGTEHDKLAMGPLPTGTRLEVLAESGVWRQVDVLDAIGGDADIHGWVHGRFIEAA